MRNKEDLPQARRIGEAADIGQQLLSPGNVQFASRQHEVALHIHLPENVVAGNHASPVLRCRF